MRSIQNPKPKIQNRHRGTVIVALVIVLVLVTLVVLGMVMGGARELDLTVRRVESLQAEYACEAGMHMAVREVFLNTDADGDGGIGSISSDGNPANNPTLGSARIAVDRTVSGTQFTLTSAGTSGVARRNAQIVVQSGGGGGTAMIAYGTSSSSPRFRLWDGSAWGSEAGASSIGTNPCWLVLRGNPTTNQFAMACLDNDTDIEVQIYNGTSWGSVLQATNDAGDKSTRNFDLAYEQVSGHLLLVYRESGTDSVRYRTHNGTSWSAEQTYTMTSGNIIWLFLTPKPGTDEIMLMCMTLDSGNAARAAIWNGSSFTNLSSASGFPPLHGGFESSSGQGLILYSQVSSTMLYRTLTGGAWSSATSGPNIGAVPVWCKMAMDSTSDALMAGTLDLDNDINVFRWSGSSWGSVLQVTGNTASVARRGFDVAYEKDSSEALVVYDTDSNTLRYRTWDGFSWTSEQLGPSGGSTPIWNVQAVPGITTGQVFVTWNMDNLQMRTATWNGSSFSAALTLGTSSTNKEYETFMAATAGGGGSTPVIYSWVAVQP